MVRGHLETEDESEEKEGENHMIQFYKCHSCLLFSRTRSDCPPRVYCWRCGDATAPGMEPDIYYAASDDYPPRKTVAEAESLAGIRAVSRTF